MEFRLNWSIDFAWGILITCHPSMDHAEYANGGKDCNDDISCPFSHLDEVLAFDPQIAYGTPVRAEIIRTVEANIPERYPRFS